jgi:hypothetical protein
MIERARLGGVLVVMLGLGWPAIGSAQEAPAPSRPMIFNLINRPADSVESRDRAFNESIKQDALAPKPSGIDDWEPQPDGSMRHRKSGIVVVVRNPCPPGDIEHEFALAAYNRANRRR